MSHCGLCTIDKYVLCWIYRRRLHSSRQTWTNNPVETCITAKPGAPSGCRLCSGNPCCKRRRIRWIHRAVWWTNTVHISNYVILTTRLIFCPGRSENSYRGQAAKSMKAEEARFSNSVVKAYTPIKITWTTLFCSSTIKINKITLMNFIQYF